MIVYTDKHKIPFTIDDDDWEIVRHYAWSIHEGYPQTHVGFGRVNSTRRNMKLHMLLKGKAPAGFEWDHEDQNPLNNKRGNLRIVTHTVNTRNGRRLIPNASGVKGITRHKRVTGAPCWKVRIHFNGTMHYVGLFETLETAKKARTEAEQVYWREP